MANPEEMPAPDTNDAGETLQPEDSYSYEDDSDPSEDLNNSEAELSVDTDTTGSLEDTSAGVVDANMDDAIDQEFT